MKRLLCLASALLLLMTVCVTGTARAKVILLPEDTLHNRWYQDKRAELKVGNPTPMSGRFFTSMWGGTTSDLDAQELLHAYSPILWDNSLGRFRFDKSVVKNMLLIHEDNGDHVYMIMLEENLVWSDGTPITVRDYAFSCLLQMSPAVRETGGEPADFSWMEGCDEYLSGEAKTVSGFRIISDYEMQITMKADSLPYFYELNRLNILPYPINEIAPGAKVADDGEGIYLTRPLTADGLQEYVLDEKIGYMSHPRVVSGPYVLAGFDGTTAKFAINPLYRGNEERMVPRIGEIDYTVFSNADMIARLQDGEIDLLDKVTRAGQISQGIQLIRSAPDKFAMENEMRTGLTMLWFTETSEIMRDIAVRKAVAQCFDRDGFIRQYAGNYGMRTDGFYGMGQWMYRTAIGMAEIPVILPENATDEEKKAYDEAVKAWGKISLDGLTVYEHDPDEAIRLLEEAGWNLNRDGEPFDSEKDQVRYKKDGDKLTGLTLTLMMPENAEALAAIETFLFAPLHHIGIALRIRTAGMDTIQDAYEGRIETDADMIYLGENLNIIFDPEILAPQTEGTELGAVKEELHQLALDMVRTDPKDLIGFERKWIRLQERITETLPLLPVYTNVYFDFFSRRLHNYVIGEARSWGNAIVPAYMSDIEELDEDTLTQLEEQLSGLE